jgi:hypothetical protein
MFTKQNPEARLFEMPPTVTLRRDIDMLFAEGRWSKVLYMCSIDYPVARSSAEAYVLYEKARACYQMLEAPSISDDLHFALMEQGDFFDTALERAQKTLLELQESSETDIDLVHLMNASLHALARNTGRLAVIPPLVATNRFYMKTVLGGGGDAPYRSLITCAMDINFGPQPVSRMFLECLYKEYYTSAVADGQDVEAFGAYNPALFAHAVMEAREARQNSRFDEAMIKGRLQGVLFGPDFQTSYE